MAAKKAAKKPASKQPKPPAPAAMGKAAAAKVSKETSAKLRGAQDANKKSGAAYMREGRPKSNDLSGYGSPKFSEIGTVSFPGGRVSQRQTKEDKRSGAYYLRPAKNLLTFESPYYLSKYNDLSSERASQRGKTVAKRAEEKKSANAKKVAKGKK